MRDKKRFNLTNSTRQEREEFNDRRVRQVNNQVISSYFFLFVFFMLLIIFL